MFDQMWLQVCIIIIVAGSVIWDIFVTLTPHRTRASCFSAWFSVLCNAATSKNTARSAQDVAAVGLRCGRRSEAVA